MTKKKTKYWVVQLAAFSFETRKKADDFRNKMEDAVAAMPDAADVTLWSCLREEKADTRVERTLLSEAIKEIEELRAAIKGKTFRVLSDDGEAWKARAEAAEAKLAKAVEALTEIRDVADISEGVEWYAMIADRALAEAEEKL